MGLQQLVTWPKNVSIVFNNLGKCKWVCKRIVNFKWRVIKDSSLHLEKGDGTVTRISFLRWLGMKRRRRRRKKKKKKEKIYNFVLFVLSSKWWGSCVVIQQMYGEKKRGIPRDCLVTNVEQFESEGKSAPSATTVWSIFSLLFSRGSIYNSDYCVVFFFFFFLLLWTPPQWLKANNL